MGRHPPAGAFGCVLGPCLGPRHRRAPTAAAAVGHDPVIARFLLAPPWAWIALAGFAQAAAVLAAGVIFLQTRGIEPVPSTPVPVAVAPPAVPFLEFKLNEGQTLIVQVGERADHLVIQPNLVDTASLMVADLEDSPTDPYADAIAFSMDILNVMEAIDGPATVVDTPADDRERGRQPTSL